MKSKNQRTIDEILDTVDFTPNREDSKSPGRNLSIWLDEEYIQKYDAVQSTTKKKFAKALRLVIKETIDKAHERLPAKSA